MSFEVVCTAAVPMAATAATTTALVSKDVTITIMSTMDDALIILRNASMMRSATASTAEVSRIPLSILLRNSLSVTPLHYEL